MLLVFYLALCLLALVQVVLMVIHAVEHRRYHRVRFAHPPGREASPYTSLFVPCKGWDIELDRNLRSLFCQNYPVIDDAPNDATTNGATTAYEICLIVESVDEPCVVVFEQLRREYPRQAARVVLAGVAEGRGQKVHNLQQATRTLPDRTEVLAFVDADARPHPMWLRRMVDRIASGKQAVCTGYRWQVPVRPTTVNLVLAASNNWLATLTSSHGLNLIWGGAWAITRRKFAELGFPDAWGGALSDDLVASRILRDAGERIAYEPWSLIASPVDSNWLEFVGFLRRQYVVAAVCVPKWWWSGLLATSLSLSMLVLSAVVAVDLARSGSSWWWGPLAAGLTYYLANVARVFSGIRAVAPFLEEKPSGTPRMLALMTWGWPLISAVHLTGLLIGQFGRTLLWRGIRYRLRSPLETEILGRTTYPEPILPPSPRATSSTPHGLGEVAGDGQRSGQHRMTDQINADRAVGHPPRGGL
jgi:ceramide glucosyltransferase